MSQRHIRARAAATPGAARSATIRSPVRWTPHRRGALLALLAPLLLSTCTDAPLATPADAPAASLLLPVLRLEAASGSDDDAQREALDAAWDRVDRIRVEVRTEPPSVEVDTVVVVTPGAEEHEFDLVLPIPPGRVLLRITLLAGDEPVFTTGDFIRGEAVPVEGGGRVRTPRPIDVPVTYVEGTDIVGLELAEEGLVLFPGVNGSFTVRRLDAGGGVIAEDTPLGWVSDDPDVATVDRTGAVTPVADGAALITVATPDGIETSAWVYVVSGTLAFVDGGAVVERVLGGGATVRGGSAARGPTYSPDGARLFWGEGGAVVEAGGGTIVAGEWPSVSPDGTKFVLERSGALFVANIDGSVEAARGAGTTPVWEDAERIVFGGGSVKRMRGDGASLETLVADGGARLPAAGGDGELAYVAPDGTVHLVGEGQVLAVPVESRPALSPDGLWVAGARAGDGQLMIAPLDEDDAPPLPVPGVSGVLDPVFRPTGDAGGPPPVVVERISPEKPIPGEEAEIRGSGFDWILPANTRVFFAGPEAELEADVLDVEPDRVTVVVPQEIVAGDVRVTTFGAAGTLPVVPATGGLVVLARAPWGAGVPGLTVVVTDPAAGGAAPEGAGAGAAASQIASGTTDASGRAVFEDLRPGLYQVQITPQDGFRVSDPGPREVRVRDDQESVTFTVQPLARGLSTIPGRLLVVVGERLDVELRPVDANGNVIPQANDVVWNSRLGHFSVGPQELEGYIEGAHPTPVEEGDTLVVTLDDRTFLLPVTVTSFIEGTITRDDGGQAQPQPGAGGPPAGIPAETFPPAAGVTVLLEKPAGTEVARATTGAAGRYRFDRLLAGTYRVRPLELDGLSPAPAFQDVTLGIESETGSADFTMSAGTVASVTVSGGGTIQALGATLSLTAVARDSANNVLGSRTTTWTSSDPSVATVDASGTVTAVDNGSAVITATVEGVSGSTSVIVDQLAVSITIQNVPPEGFATGFIGDSRQITAIAKDANGFDVTDAVPSWTSSAPSVASVSSTGMWNALAPGQAVITASMDGVSDALTTFVLQVLAGTLTITNQTDLDNAAAQFYGRITGDLNVNFTPLADLDGLDFLETVEGTVSIQGNGSLLDLDALARLDSIGGDLTVFDNDLLDPPFGSSASLRAVGGSVLIDDNDGLRNLDLFGNVQVIGGDLTIRFNSALENLDGLTSLTQIGGDLIVEFNAISSLNNLPALRQVEGGVSLDDPGTVFGMPALEVVVQNGLSLGGVSGGLITETLDFPALACIGGQLQIYNNSVLTDAHFPSLTEIRFVCPPVLPLIGFSSTPPPPDLVIEMNVALGTLDLDALARVEGEVIFESNGLTTFDLPSLTDVTGSFRVSDDAFLDSFSAAALTQIGGGLVIRNNSALTSFDLSSLMSVNGSCFCAPPAPSDGGPSGAPLPPPNSFSEAEIRNNTSLATWDMTALDEVDQLIIDGNTSLVTIPAMPNLGTGTPSIVIHVTDNTLLTSLAGFSGLGTASLLNIQNNPILGSLAGLESLTQVGQLALNQNGLVSVKLPNLTTVDRALQIQNEALLSSVSFPSLALIGAGSGVSPSDGIISLFNLPALTALSLPSLTEVDSQIHVQATGLADLDAFTGVQSGLASVLVTGNGSLTDVTGLANLGLAIAGDPIVTGNFTITINPALCGSDAAALVATLESHHPGSPAIAGSIDTTTGNQLCGGED